MPPLLLTQFAFVLNRILASAPNAPIFECALDTILQHVRNRYIPSNDLQLTGPKMLHECYEKFSDNVAITYLDSRNAVWPHSGLRAGHQILAYELPNIKRVFGSSGDGRTMADEDDYAALFRESKVYTETCPL